MSRLESSWKSWTAKNDPLECAWETWIDLYEQKRQEEEEEKNPPQTQKPFDASTAIGNIIQNIRRDVHIAHSKWQEIKNKNKLL